MTDDVVLERGDVATLALSTEGEGMVPTLDGERVQLMLGTDIAPAVEAELLGAAVGDDGTLEVVADDGGTALRRPTKVEGVVPDPAAGVLERAGIRFALEFAAADADALADEFLLDSTRVTALQDDVRERLDGRRLVNYDIVDAHRWRTLPIEEAPDDSGTESSAPDATAAGTRDEPAIETVTDWPTFGGNAARTGAVDGGIDGTTTSWTFETDARVRSSPAIADGTVYVGSEDNSMYALAAADGSVRWTFETGGSGQSSPTVADGTIYVGSEDDSVYALDRADGSVRWSYETGSRVRSSPAVADGSVYVGRDDNSVHALDAGDGSVRWRYETGYRVRSCPTVADGTVYVGSDDGNVYALDAETGGEQ